MYTLGTGSSSRQQQTPSQPLSRSVPHRQQEYYHSSNFLVPHPPLTATNSASSFADDNNRLNSYSQTSEHFYTNGRSTDDNTPQQTDGRDQVASPTTDPNQPRNRITIISTDTSTNSTNQGRHHFVNSSKSSHPSSSLLKRDVIDTFSLGGPYVSFHPESSASIVSTRELHLRSDFWPDNTSSVPQPGALPKVKKRRKKPRIELAPDQPPTTQGKPRARVYVACQQCRNRKIRCDGAKPVCHNCGRRTNGNSECNYDPVPKRRGPDRTPGARQRTGRDMLDGIDSVLSRRRRRTRVDVSTVATEIDAPLKEPHYPGALQDLGQSISDSIHLSLSLEVPTETARNASNVLPVFDCSPASGPLYDLVVGILSDERRPTSSVTTYINRLGVDADISPQYSVNPGRSYLIGVDEQGNERQRSSTPDIGSEPSLNFSRKIWWDSLLSSYISPTLTPPGALTVSQRESASQSIASDIRFIFRASNYWFSFFHLPSFFSNFFDPARRERIQPSLVLGLLAISTFWQSSEIGYGASGRERALRFRDEAQAAMDASFNSGWIDETLAQAAWLLALFEVCAHPRHSSERSTSSMVLLDSIIRSLSLTLVDANDPNTTMFPQGTVPAVDTPKGYRSQRLYAGDTSPVHSVNGAAGCSCQTLKLQEHWPSAAEHAPLWSATPAWDNSWTEAEIRKESCRRLCWSSMILAAGHISYTTAQRSEGLDLFITDPANYALLFSGESVARSPILAKHSSKNTIWALYDRSFLLWHGCIRMRQNNAATDNEKADFAMKAWLEADSLERALNCHTCALERAFIFQAREYIFNTRMCISYEFQRYIPLVTADVSGLFHKKKAEEWLTHQATVAKRFMFGLHTITGNAENLLARRPFFVFWFMGQIHRAIALWECDRSLTVALDVCKALTPAIDYLTVLWPCPEQRLRYKLLYEKVERCCLEAGLKPPSKIDLSLPLPPLPENLV
ncbi:hypothetical protein CPB84DRAFT_1843323 [Gymnopilus junonius]|uniref:Zn(2)-C6 fungal-type domain-containing protein n=1 Tax=Gymnopilus junonius TaxID=109634 RepID=A0A9P5TRM4_GYMJU|nr:hypothetical protein CPB84DRAFT_1843323 [Gymnopilus junonius]